MPHCLFMEDCLMQENISPTSAVPRMFIIPVLLALVAALITQIAHEATHAIAMLVVGNGVQVMQLFAVAGVPVVDETAQMVISGSAAVLNIIVGMLAGLAFYLPAARAAARVRLLLLYLAAYMLMTGFGYFMIDALFYAPDAPFFPDWQQVIHILGGGWEVRAPLLIIGVVGLLGLFFWLPNAALRFVSDPTDKAARGREMLALTLVPYIAVNVIFTLLSLLHPLGVQGVVLAVFQYWFGYIALFWAYFIGGMWTEVKQPYGDASALPAPVLPVWLIGLAVMWAVIAFVMLPGIRFSA
jgi:hypothetical protein